MHSPEYLIQQYREYECCQTTGVLCVSFVDIGIHIKTPYTYARQDCPYLIDILHAIFKKNTITPYVIILTSPLLLDLIVNCDVMLSTSVHANICCNRLSIMRNAYIEDVTKITANNIFIPEFQPKSFSVAAIFYGIYKISLGIYTNNVVKLCRAFPDLELVTIKKHLLYFNDIFIEYMTMRGIAVRVMLNDVKMYIGACSKYLNAEPKAKNGSYFIISDTKKIDDIITDINDKNAALIKNANK
jgi:hypothetical protein